MFKFIKNNIMKRFIPLNNNINKLIAFTPSLDKEYRNSQRIPSKPYQIETLDVVENLQDKGWKIKGSYQHRNKRTKQIQNHTIKMEHPDFSIFNLKGNTEAIANLIITNSCDGSNSLELDLGAKRLVCSNGLISRESLENQKIHHTEKDFFLLNDILSNLNIKANSVLNEFNSWKEKYLTPQEMEDFATQASKIRFQDKIKLDSSQLLNTVRDEDKGNGLWEVYNRVQENLTQPNRLVDLNGKPILGIYDIKEDINVNSKLSSLAHSYI